MARKKTPRRDRRAMDSKFIPLSTEGDAEDVEQLLKLWRHLSGKPRWGRARAVIGRMLTTTNEDV